ncbi:MAG: hypothetical protein JWP58_2136 [Hymenobacter sp.]|nr:hypothetical protein [Hymenobacter sp.]
MGSSRFIAGICLMLALLAGCNSARYTMVDIGGAAAKGQAYLLPQAYLRRIPGHVYWGQFDSRVLTGLYVVPIEDFYTSPAPTAAGKGSPSRTSAYNEWLNKQKLKPRVFNRFSLLKLAGSTFNDYTAVHRHRNDLYVVLNLDKLYGPGSSDRSFYAMLGQLRIALDEARQKADWPKGHHPQEVVRTVFEQAPQPAHLSLTEYAGPSLPGRNSVLVVPDLKIVTTFSRLNKAAVVIDTTKPPTVRPFPPAQDRTWSQWLYSPLGIIESTIVRVSPMDGSLHFADCAYDAIYHKSFPETRDSSELKKKLGITFFKSLCQLNAFSARYISIQTDTVPALLSMTYAAKLSDPDMWYNSSPKTSFTCGASWEKLAASMATPSRKLPERSFYIWPAQIAVEVPYYLNGKKGFARLGSTLLNVLSDSLGQAQLQKKPLKQVRVERPSEASYTQVRFPGTDSLRASFGKFYLKAGDRIYTDESL